MGSEVRERIREGLDVARSYAVCVLWMAALQFMSCVVCWGVLLLFGRNFDLEWLVYTVGLLLPFAWGVAGYCLPMRFRPRGRWQNVSFWFLWIALPAALSAWADSGGPDRLWLVCSPRLMARLSWFYPLFEGLQSALVLDTLQPLATAGVHVLMMAGFLLGLWLGRKKKKVKYV